MQWGECGCKYSGVRVKQLEWNEVDVSEHAWVDWNGCEWKSTGMIVKGLEWNEVDVSERAWVHWSECEHKSSGMKVKGIEWNEVDLNVSLVSNESDWIWVECGGYECKSSV
jgi:hypothetical protein